MRIAKAKYALGHLDKKINKTISTYNESLTLLLQNHIDNYVCEFEINEFRVNELWTKEIDTFFKANINTLNTLFKKIMSTK